VECAQGFSFRKEQGNVSFAVRGTPGGFVPVKRHAIRENSRLPFTHVTGRDSRTLSRYVWKCPAAQ
jgi:hypothetical protein